MKYEIRELSLGGILDQAIKVAVDNFVILFVIACIIQVPVGFPLQLMMGDGSDPEQTMQAFQNPLFWGITLLSIPLSAISNAAIVTAVAKAYLGQKPTVGESFSRALNKFVPLLLTSILMGLAIFGGLLLCVIPGILCAIWFALATQVVVLESKSGTTALGRSKELMKGYAGKWFVLMIVLGMIGGGVGMGAQLIGQLIGVEILRAITVTLAQTVGFVISSAVLVVLYFSTRCTHENFDLELLASSFEGTAAPPSDKAEEGVWSES